MNRAERRKRTKQLTPANIESRVQDILKIEREEARKEKHHIISTLMTMTAWVLHLEGYGKKRLTDIMNRIYYNIDCFNSGHLTPDDYDEIKKELEKMGVKF